MYQKSFFSVVIPLYNKELNIANTINSVLAQTNNDFEIIVINDGSTDDGATIVSKFTDKRIKLFSIKNSGAATARNYGVKQAKSEHIAFLDADDYWYPNHLENLKMLIQKFPEGKWYASAYEILHNKHLTLPMKSPILGKGEAWMGEVDNFFEHSLVDCLAWTSAVCMKKQFFEDIGKFKTELQVDQDTDLWIRAGIMSNLYFSNTITAKYNLLGENRISYTSVQNRNIMDFDAYEDLSKSNPYLKKYLDLNRFAVAIRFKTVNDIKRFNTYKNKINPQSLSIKQRFILNLNGFFTRILFYIQYAAKKRGIRIRTA